MSLVSRLGSRGGYGLVLAECLDCFSVDLVLVVSSYAGFPEKLPPALAKDLVAETHPLRAELDGETRVPQPICRAYLFANSSCLVPCGWIFNRNAIGSHMHDPDCLQDDYFNRKNKYKPPERLWDLAVAERLEMDLARLRETGYGLEIWYNTREFSMDICLLVASYAGYPQPLPDDVAKSFFDKTPFLAPQLDIKPSNKYHRIKLIQEEWERPSSAKTWQVVHCQIGADRRDPKWAVRSYDEFLDLRRAWIWTGILRAPDRLISAWLEERLEMKQA